MGHRLTRKFKVPRAARDESANGRAEPQPRQAGAVIGVVVCATIFGMAFGGYVSGVIFDLTGSYRAAFLNGVAWNAVNLTVVGWLFWRRRAQAERLAAA